MSEEKKQGPRPGGFSNEEEKRLRPGGVLLIQTKTCLRPRGGFCYCKLNANFEIVTRQLETAINNASKAEELKRSEENLKENLDQLSNTNRYEETINTIT